MVKSIMGPIIFGKGGARMSVILDCRPGDEFVCLAKFHASPDGQGFSWETSRTFQIGERLRYVGSRLEPRFHDRPYSWQVIFEAADGKRYAATQTYFVTDECWRGIEQHFCQAAAEA